MSATATASQSTAYSCPVFAIRATPAQRLALKSEAERRGVTQSDLVRSALAAAGVPLWGSSEQG